MAINILPSINILKEALQGAIHGIDVIFDRALGIREEDLVAEKAALPKEADVGLSPSKDLIAMAKDTTLGLGKFAVVNATSYNLTPLSVPGAVGTSKSVTSAALV